MNVGPSVLFRCDGSPEIGLGHVVRCLALADELQEAHRCKVAFAMRRGPLGFEMVQQKGYPVLRPPADGGCFHYPRWLAEVIGRVDAQTLVLDVRDDLPQAVVEGLRAQGVLIVTLDDSSQRRLAADLAFYPPVPQVQRLDWTGFDGEVYVGWKWVVLQRKIAHTLPHDLNSAIDHRRSRILVTMGGSDQAGLTLKAVEALNLLEDDFETVVVLGPGFGHHKVLRALLSKTPRRFDVRQNETDMPGLMAEVDLAVASFGVTAYELAVMGVPAIYLCLTEDHARSASVFVESGIALCLGVFEQVSERVLAATIKRVLSDRSGLARMADCARQRVDGRGAERIARTIVFQVKSHIRK